MAVHTQDNDVNGYKTSLVFILKSVNKTADLEEAVKLSRQSSDAQNLLLKTKDQFLRNVHCGHTRRVVF